ncbi:RND superfamily putative drug exporter [Actinocorallia herbida]|uniref:RND superfamily putative drug exporter n=1 Tax=Actinocorallia herbida TaxID=58109 RepID=A0A3N1CSN7_9ACTN|nr:MMPL family transporter [Actinocorallia herbida]ROO84331.1 RND superfamily putative drug exporter [Actinocorallia herbida]
MESFDDRTTTPGDPPRLSAAARLAAPVIAAVTGRRSKWAVVAVALAASLLVLAFGGTATKDDGPGAALPKGAESAAVAELKERLPGAEIQTAMAVFDRAGGPFTEADKAFLAERAAAFAPTALNGQVGRAVFAEDDGTALILVPLGGDLRDDALADAVGDLRTEAKAGLPDGVTAQVTGGAAFSVDLSSVFDGANTALLGATALVVALLLLITYRSPWLWLVPLTVVGIGDQVATKAVSAFSRWGVLTVDGSTLGITSVLVFGAGTNYALLVIARYREELRLEDDKHVAMRRVLAGAGPAVLASSGTVFLALLSLAFAVTPFSRNIGLAGAVGIAVAVVYALVVLPSALLLFGRGLFWPFTPRVGQHDKTGEGVWGKTGRFVARRPAVVAAASAVVLAGLALTATGITTGLAQTEQFRTPVEATEGQKTIAAAFPAGVADPVIVLAKAATAEQVRTAAAGVEGVAESSVGETDGDLTKVTAVLTAEPGTEQSFQTLRDLRAAVSAVPDSDALVGGTQAEDLDKREAAERDQRVIMPLVLAIVMAILLLLLRSVVAAVLLIGTVVASFAASVGAGWMIFHGLLGFPAFGAEVPLLAFLFLVALGVDYNIFLVTRAREESVTRGTREGVVRGLAVTGGVITSAGILLASVFTVLGVLPLLTLTQIGVIVAVGVLLDTLLVRSILVPALVVLLGDRFWWPATPAKAIDEPAKELATAP